LRAGHQGFARFRKALLEFVGDGFEKAHIDRCYSIVL
jgi:hypothetical protein